MHMKTIANIAAIYSIITLAIALANFTNVELSDAEAVSSSF